MAWDCKGNSFFSNSKFFVEKFFIHSDHPFAGVFYKEPYATLAQLSLNKDLNLGPHD